MILASPGDCDWKIYNFISSKINNNQYSAHQGRELIGADNHFFYFYNFRSDTITCEKLSHDFSTVVAGEMRRVNVYDTKHMGIFSCIVVIVLSGTALFILRGLPRPTRRTSMRGTSARDRSAAQDALVR